MDTTLKPFRLRRAELIHNVCLLAHGLLGRYPAGRLSEIDHGSIAAEALSLHRLIVLGADQEQTGLRVREDFEGAAEQAAQDRSQSQRRTQAGWTPSEILRTPEPARPLQDPGPYGISFPEESPPYQEPSNPQNTTSLPPGDCPQNPS